MSIQRSALAVMATKYNVEAPKLLDTLKSTLMPKASNEEMMAFCLVANSYDLNPFTKEIYAFPNRSGGISPVVSVDGWMKLMNRQPSFDGISFRCDEQDGKPVSVTATIFLKDRSRPVEVTEYFSECFRATDPWKSHPRRMLRHKALIQAARVAFGFSGIQDEDEAFTTTVTTTTVEPSKPIFKTIQSAPIEAELQSEHSPQNETQLGGNDFEASSTIETAKQEPASTIQEQLGKIIEDAGFGFDVWKAFASKIGVLDNDPGDWREVSDAAAKRCVSARAGMLRAMKGGTK